MLSSHVVLPFLYLLGGAQAVQLLSNSTIPLNLTAGCSSALAADVNCDRVLPALSAGSFYPESTLNRTCTSDCSNALASWEANIASSCSGQTWTGLDDETMPLTIIPDLIRYHYNLTCITDSGRFCNNIGAQAAYAADPSSGDPVYGGSFASGNASTAPQPVSPCDLCLIKNLQFQADSPYYAGPDLAASSIYQSLTSSCKVTGYPLNPTSTIPFFTPTSSASPTPTSCAGKTYTIQPGDTCYSIAKSQGIGTGWILSDNSLTAYCADFPTSGSLCLQNTCSIYTVGQNDTCAGIASAHNITQPQLLAWNPVINPGCYNIDRLNGTQFCVSAPGTPYVPPSGASSLPPLTPTSAAPVPTDMAQGSNTNCGRWYKAVAGDYCNLITIKYSISLQDFTFLNPEINANCTNLYAEESYCVAAVGDINTYSGRPGYATSTSVASYTPFSSIPTATTTQNVTLPTTLPLANGTRADCNYYFDGGLFQGSVTFYKSQCELAAVVYGVDPVQFNSWNQGLNLSDPSCSFASNTSYCGKLYFGEQAPANDLGIEYPIRDGASNNCTLYTDAYDGRTCQDILTTYDLVIAQFYAYNPAVKNDCSGMWPEYAYCVRTPDYVDQVNPDPTKSGTPTSSSTTTPTKPSPTSPTQSGEPDNCNKWYTAQDGDSCQSVADKFFITLNQFYTWNPAVSKDCTTGFWLNEAYCVGTTDTISQTRSAPSSTTSSTPAPAPTPNQPGNAISNCNKYAAAQSGDYCSAFADRNKITLTQLYAWNSVLGSDGSGCANNFYANYYYCVGVSS